MAYTVCNIKKCVHTFYHKLWLFDARYRSSIAIQHVYEFMHSIVIILIYFSVPEILGCSDSENVQRSDIKLASMENIHEKQETSQDRTNNRKRKAPADTRNNHHTMMEAPLGNRHEIGENRWQGCGFDS